jgi:hypothetical protein
MKIAVIILGILGSLAFGGLGAKWVSDYQDNKAQIKSLAKLAASLGGGKTTEVDAAIKAVERTKDAGYVMIGVALLALAASILVGKFGKLSGAAILVGTAIPAAMAPLSLVAGFLLVIAGILALFVKTAPPAQQRAAARLAA